MIDWHYDKAQDLFQVRCSGVFEDAHLMSFLEEIVAAVGARDHAYVLVDDSELMRSMNYQQVTKMIRYFLSKPGKVRNSHLAVVVKTSQGMIIMRLLASIAPMLSCDAKGFTSLSQAKTWLAKIQTKVISET